MFIIHFLRNSTNILLLLLIALVINIFIKINQTNEQVIATNRLVYETLVNKRVAELQKVQPRDIVVGDTNAPITMVMYTKYGCEYCRAFLSKSYPIIYDEYIEPGFVKIVFRFLESPAYSQYFNYMSYAHQCYENGKYQNFSQLLNNTPISALNDSTFTIITKKIGIPPNHKEYDMQKIYEEAKKSGIYVTPVFIIDKKVYKGNKPLSYFKRILDEALDICSE